MKDWNVDFVYDYFCSHSGRLSIEHTLDFNGALTGLFKRRIPDPFGLMGTSSENCRLTAAHGRELLHMVLAFTPVILQEILAFYVNSLVVKIDLQHLDFVRNRVTMCSVTPGGSDVEGIINISIKYKVISIKISVPSWLYHDNSGEKFHAYKYFVFLLTFSTDGTGLDWLQMLIQ